MVSVNMKDGTMERKYKTPNGAFSSEGDFVEIRVLVLNFAKPSVPAPP